MRKSCLTAAILLGWAASDGTAQPIMTAPSAGLQGQVPHVPTPPPPDLSSSGPVRVDVTGKLYRYVDGAGNVVMGPVEVDGYGHDIHRDQYGRAVRAVPLDGRAGTIILPPR